MSLISISIVFPLNNAAKLIYFNISIFHTYDAASSKYLSVTAKVFVISSLPTLKMSALMELLIPPGDIIKGKRAETVDTKFLYRKTGGGTAMNNRPPD